MGQFQDDAKNAADRLGRSEVWMENGPCTDVVRDQSARVAAEIMNQLQPIVEAIDYADDYVSKGVSAESTLSNGEKAVLDARNGMVFIQDLCRRMRGGK